MEWSGSLYCCYFSDNYQTWSTLVSTRSLILRTSDTILSVLGEKGKQKIMQKSIVLSLCHLIYERDAQERSTKAEVGSIDLQVVIGSSLATAKGSCVSSSFKVKWIKLHIFKRAVTCLSLELFFPKIFFLAIEFNNVIM